MNLALLCVCEEAPEQEEGSTTISLVLGGGGNMQS